MSSITSVGSASQRFACPRSRAADGSRRARSHTLPCFAGDPPVSGGHHFPSPSPFRPLMTHQSLLVGGSRNSGPFRRQSTQHQHWLRENSRMTAQRFGSSAITEELVHGHQIHAPCPDCLCTISFVIAQRHQTCSTHGLDTHQNPHSSSCQRGTASEKY